MRSNWYYGWWPSSSPQQYSPQAPTNRGPYSEIVNTPVRFQVPGSPTPGVVAATPNTQGRTDSEGEAYTPVDHAPTRRILKPKEGGVPSKFYQQRNYYNSLIKDTLGQLLEKAMSMVVWNEMDKRKSGGTPAERRIDEDKLVQCIYALLVFLYQITPGKRRLKTVGVAFAKAAKILLDEYFPEPAMDEHIKERLFHFVYHVMSS